VGSLWAARTRVQLPPHGCCRRHTHEHREMHRPEAERVDALIALMQDDCCWVGRQIQRASE